MDKIVMTLLVRRYADENTRCPYAVQISLPRELTPGALAPLVSVRLITTTGTRASVLETMDFYHPEQWRAASRGEQVAFTAAFSGDPRPWHCVMRSLSKSVYDYVGAGDRGSNNGQVWSEGGTSGDEWKTEQDLAHSCREELDADWNSHLARVVGGLSQAH